MTLKEMQVLIVELWKSGDIPTQAMGMDVFLLARDTEISVESVANAMDFWGLDGSVAYDMALELEEV